MFNFAGGLVELAFALDLFVVGQRPCRFLHASFGFVHFACHRTPPKKVNRSFVCRPFDTKQISCPIAGFLAIIALPSNYSEVCCSAVRSRSCGRGVPCLESSTLVR